MIKFSIPNRFTGKSVFECEIDCADGAPWSVKITLAVKLAIEKKADLSWANLSEANLSEANLSEADLSWANLSRANLSEANLWAIKKDFFEKLLLAKKEVAGLYDFIMRGKIDGSCYEGKCCCFVGSIAKVAGQNYQNLSCGLSPNAQSAIERWFMGILPGDTPDNNQISKITARWIMGFCAENNISLPEYKIVSSLEFPEAFEPAGGE